MTPSFLLSVLLINIIFLQVHSIVLVVTNSSQFIEAVQAPQGVTNNNTTLEPVHIFVTKSITYENADVFWLRRPDALYVKIACASEDNIVLLCAGTYCLRIHPETKNVTIMGCTLVGGIIATDDASPNNTLVVTIRDVLLDGKFWLTPLQLVGVASLYMRNVTVQGGWSHGDGGCVSLIDVSGSVTMRDCVIRNCNALHQGGCFYLTGNSSAGESHGDVTNSTTSISMHRVSLNHCSSTVSEGGGFVIASAKSVELRQLKVNDSKSLMGGGCGNIMDVAEDVELTNSEFTNCWITYYSFAGGCLHASHLGRMNIKKSYFSNCTSTDIAGCMRVEIVPKVVMEDITMTKCKAKFGGGATLLEIGDVTLLNVNISNSTAVGDVGGCIVINASNTVTITNMTLSQCVANESSCAVIESRNTSTVRMSGYNQIWGCSGPDQGAGLVLRVPSVVNITGLHMRNMNGGCVLVNGNTADVTFASTSLTRCVGCALCVDESQSMTTRHVSLSDSAPCLEANSSVGVWENVTFTRCGRFESGIVTYGLVQKETTKNTSTRRRIDDDYFQRKYNWPLITWKENDHDDDDDDLVNAAHTSHTILRINEVVSILSPESAISAQMFYSLLSTKCMLLVKESSSERYASWSSLASFVPLIPTSLTQPAVESLWTTVGIILFHVIHICIVCFIQHKRNCTWWVAIASGWYPKLSFRYQTIQIVPMCAMCTLALRTGDVMSSVVSLFGVVLVVGSLVSVHCFTVFALGPQYHPESSTLMSVTTGLWPWILPRGVWGPKNAATLGAAIFGKYRESSPQWGCCTRQPTFASSSQPKELLPSSSPNPHRGARSQLLLKCRVHG
eukprot:PhF_6_TR36533/c0_g1_i1/m.53851